MYTKFMNLQLSYWLDDDNIIRRVNDHWDQAMDSQNWSDRASANRIVGKLLSEFICDDVTRMYVATMIESVRVIPHTSFRPYRCDTPDMKRFMQMIITPEDNGWIRISHELLRIEPLEKPVTFSTVTEFSPLRQYKNNQTIHFVRCSICNRLQRYGNRDNTWYEADSLIARSHALSESLKVIYGVCLDCPDKLR